MGKDRSSLRYLLKRKYRVAHLPLVQDELAAWFDESFGQKLYEWQKVCCQRSLSQVFGYRLAQIGISPRHSFLENLQPSHKFILSRAHDDASCQCEFDALPLPSGTIDIVLLHHVLDFSGHPHAALIEAARLVTAGGHIVIIGFNPFSLFGLYKWPAVIWPGKAIWRHNSLRKGRVIDWLQLLGFQVSSGSLGCDGTNGGQFNRWTKRFMTRDLSQGAFYMIVAQKMVTPLRPIKPRDWSPLKAGSLVGLKPIKMEKKCLRKKKL